MNNDRRIRASLNQTNLNASAEKSIGPEVKITLAPGLSISGNAADGYTIALLGDDGVAVEEFTKVRPAPGDVTLLFLSNNPQPFLLQSSGGGSGSNTVQFVEGSQSHFLSG
jgi:hypothetical protein